MSQCRPREAPRCGCRVGVRPASAHGRRCRFRLQPSARSGRPSPRVRSRACRPPPRTQPGGPHGRLERPASQEGVLGLARVRRRRLRGRQHGRHDEHLRRRPVLGRVASGRAGAGPLRPAAGQGGRFHPERQAHRQGPGVPGRGRGRDGPHLAGAVRQERQVAAGRRRRRVSADGHAALVNFEIAGDSTEAEDRVDPTSPRSRPLRRGTPPWTSSRSATPAPTRRSTRSSARTSRRRASSRCRSR